MPKGPLTAGSATHRTPKLEGRVNAPDSAIGAVERPVRAITFRNELLVRCLERHDRRLTATMTPLPKLSSAQTSSALSSRR
jgi:hypothetical protein